MTADEAATTLPPILAAKARNPLQVELATILTGATPPEQLTQLLTTKEPTK
ncbi:hypothetical protein M1D89_20220 [Arthrobacter sp. D3-18]